MSDASPKPEAQIITNRFPETLASPMPILPEDVQPLVANILDMPYDPDDAKGLSHTFYNVLRDAMIERGYGSRYYDYPTEVWPLINNRKLLGSALKLCQYHIALTDEEPLPAHGPQSEVEADALAKRLSGPLLWKPYDDPSKPLDTYFEGNQEITENANAIEEAEEAYRPHMQLRHAIRLRRLSQRTTSRMEDDEDDTEQALDEDSIWDIPIGDEEHSFAKLLTDELQHRAYALPTMVDDDGNDLADDEEIPEGELEAMAIRSLDWHTLFADGLLMDRLLDWAEHYYTDARKDRPQANSEHAFNPVLQRAADMLGMDKIEIDVDKEFKSLPSTRVQNSNVVPLFPKETIAR